MTGLVTQGLGVGITVPTTSNPPTANFTADRTTIAVGIAVQFTDKSTNTPTSWAWQFGDGQLSSSQHPTHTYTSAGKYTVTLSVTNDEGGDTLIKTDYINVLTAATWKLKYLQSHILKDYTLNSNIRTGTGT